MNTTTTRGAHIVRPLRLAALAVPVAAALTMGAGATAHADDAIDPVLVQVVSLDEGFDPAVPVGPGDMTTEEDCQQTDTCGGGGDDDGEDPGTDDPTVPEGPGGYTTEDDCQQTDTCGGGGDDDGEEPGTDEPGTEEPGTEEPGTEEPGPDSGTDYDKPTRIDAGTAESPDTGLTLSWMLPGGLLVTAAGLAFAARRVRADGGS